VGANEQGGGALIVAAIELGASSGRCGVSPLEGVAENDRLFGRLQRGAGAPLKGSTWRIRVGERGIVRR